MVFGSKPKKLGSLKPGDKRRIFLLNSDFKIVTGIESKRFRKTTTHFVSPVQLVAGSTEESVIVSTLIGMQFKLLVVVKQDVGYSTLTS